MSNAPYTDRFLFFVFINIIIILVFKFIHKNLKCTKLWLSLDGEAAKGWGKTDEETVKHVREHAHTKRKQQSVNINWNNHSQS